MGEQRYPTDIVDFAMDLFRGAFEEMVMESVKMTEFVGLHTRLPNKSFAVLLHF